MEHKHAPRARISCRRLLALSSCLARHAAQFLSVDRDAHRPHLPLQRRLAPQPRDDLPPIRRGAAARSVVLERGDRSMCRACLVASAEESGALRPRCSKPRPPHSRTSRRTSTAFRARAVRAARSRRATGSRNGRWSLARRGFADSCRRRGSPGLPQRRSPRLQTLERHRRCLPILRLTPPLRVCRPRSRLSADLLTGKSRPHHASSALSFRWRPYSVSVISIRSRTPQGNRGSGCLAVRGFESAPHEPYPLGRAARARLHCLRPTQP